LANRAAPGLKSSYKLAPPGANKNKTKSAPQPANDDGKPIEKAWSNFENKTSKPINIIAANNGFGTEWIHLVGVLGSSSPTTLLVENRDSNVGDLHRLGLLGFCWCGT